MLRGLAPKSGSYFGSNTAEYAGFFGFACNRAAYCSDSCSLRNVSDGSLASTCRLSIGDVLNAPRHRRNALLALLH